MTKQWNFELIISLISLECIASLTLPVACDKTSFIQSLIKKNKFLENLEIIK
jgi:hypothetical protein